MSFSDKRVLVGMSGGIDSTATCLMLKEQGYEIVGLTMWVWGDEPQDARRLAQSMGIDIILLMSGKLFVRLLYRILLMNIVRGELRIPVSCVIRYLNSAFLRSGLIG